jgi:hypothetical protein
MVVCGKRIDVSEVNIASVCSSETSVDFHRTTRVTFQKTEFFTVIAVKISNLTK